MIKLLRTCIRNISTFEKMLALSILFTMSFVVVRILYTGELTYCFYIWNTFLAVLPLLFSRALPGKDGFNVKTIMLITAWLLFFPNAPYMITDLFHYSDRPPVPGWFDLLLVTTAAWNGLILGIVSLMQVEQYLHDKLNPKWVQFIIITCCVLCGYGVYIGRYLRFNSWDTITDPGRLLYTIFTHICRPQEHPGTWAFTMAFGAMFGIIYFTLKQFNIKLANTPTR